MQCEDEDFELMNFCLAALYISEVLSCCVSTLRSILLFATLNHPPSSPFHPHAFLLSPPLLLAPFNLSLSYFSTLRQSGVMTTVITTASARSGIAMLRTVI